MRALHRQRQVQSLPTHCHQKQKRLNHALRLEFRPSCQAPAKDQQPPTVALRAAARMSRLPAKLSDSHRLRRQCLPLPLHRDVPRHLFRHLRLVLQLQRQQAHHRNQAVQR